MHDTNVAAEFSRLIQPHVRELEAVLRGTIAQPLVEEQHQLQAELKTASANGDEEKSRAMGRELMAIGQELDKLVEHLPVVQLRWVAAAGDANLPVDIMPDAHDPTKTYRLLKGIALDEHDVASAGVTQYQSDRKEITLQMNPRGGAKLGADSGKKLGHSLAVTWKDQVVQVLDAWRIDDQAAALTGNIPDAGVQPLLDLWNHRASAQTVVQAKPNLATQMSQQIQAWVPSGTSLAAARRIMEQHEFTCAVASYDSKAAMPPNSDTIMWDNGVFRNGKAEALTNLTLLTCSRAETNSAVWVYDATLTSLNGEISGPYTVTSRRTK
jgi:hypothetical protein